MKWLSANAGASRFSRRLRPPLLANAAYHPARNAKSQIL
jgi:hypothetical protein